MREGNLQLGFVETPHLPRNLNTATIQDDELAVVVSPEHPWARLPEGVTLEELAAYHDRGRTPAIAAIEGDPQCRAVLDSMDRLGALSGFTDGTRLLLSRGAGRCGQARDVLHRFEHIVLIVGGGV